MEDAVTQAALPDGRRPGVQMEFGFERVLVADHWGPLRVTLLGGDQPVDGVIEVEYRGRRSGFVTISAPFAVGPDQSAPVDIAVPFDDWFSKLQINVYDSRRRVLRRFLFEDWSDLGFERAPQVLTERQVVVGVVGPTTIDIAEREWARIGATVFEATSPESVSPTEDGAQETETAKPEELPAGAQTRIVRVDAGELPPLQSSYDMLSGLVIAGDALDQLNRTVVSAIGDWVASGGRLAIVFDQPGTDVARWLEDGVLDVDSTPTTQSTGRFARSIRLPDSAQPTSWRALGAEESGAGIPIADGPYGLGWLVVVGASPTEDVVSEEEAAAAWNAVLEPLVGDRTRAIPSDQQNQVFWWQGASRERSALLNALAGDLENVRAIGFWPIFLVLLGLAALLGPVDYIILRKRSALHRSWITALCWIGAFTAIGAVAPGVLRSADTQLRRISAVDVAQADGIAYGAAVTGVFAGESGGIALEGIDRASRWRPTMVGGATTFGGAISLLRTADGGAVPPRLPLRRWTFLTVLDESPMNDVPQVMVRLDADNQLEARVEGLAGASVRSAVAYVPGRWIALDTESDGDWMRSADASEQNLPPGEWRQEDAPADEPWMWTAQTSSPEYRPSLATGLPGADARLALLQRRVDRGEGVLVMLDLEGGRPGVAAPDTPDQSQRAIYRILAPSPGPAHNAREVNP